jgi:uncharacterized protein YqcC (DUF446 family)
MTSAVLKTLDEIEAEMRRIGYWSDSPELRPGSCEGRFASYLDAPTFRVWLQTLFLPNARAAALEGDCLRAVRLVRLCGTNTRAMLPLQKLGGCSQ